MIVDKKPYFIIDGTGYPTAEKAATVLVTNLIGSGKEAGGGEAERIANLILSHAEGIAEIIAWLRFEKEREQSMETLAEMID